MPSCDACNRRKGARTLDNYSTDIAYVLDAAKDKATQIADTVQKMRAGKLFSSIQIRLRAGIENQILDRNNVDKLFEYANSRLTSLLTNSPTAQTFLLSASTNFAMVSIPTNPLAPTVLPQTTGGSTSGSGFRQKRTSKHSKGRRK